MKKFLLPAGLVLIAALLSFCRQNAAKGTAENDRKNSKPEIEMQDTAHGTAAFELWQAGGKVSAEDVAQYGTDRCFSSAEIDEQTFRRMYGKSFKENCTLPRGDLRYLKVLHYDLGGSITLGEMVCNKAIAGDLLEIFRTLYEARYPIERMVLIDRYDADDERSMRDNNSSSFNFRFISGTQRISKHGKGMAVDINPLYNPCVQSRTGETVIEPATGAPYADRTKEFPCKIDENDLCYKEFTRRGFEWGGHWTSLKDYQHFEKPE